MVDEDGVDGTANKDALKEAENYKLLAEQNGDWQRDQGMTITENWLTAHGDKLKLIFSNNDEMALGAVEATEAAGREDIIIMGEIGRAHV